jgi:propionyl-CoA carboxylase alpha chain
VRNDTGVFEGGEISIYYDPMIAKLCTWAPDRPTAIEAMRDALDGFEIEGIGHNLPFLSAVMDNPRFVEGEISTGFIAEEYPDGFAGALLPPETLRRLAALAAHLHSVRETRAAQIFGAIQNHGRKLGSDWVVLIDRAPWPLSLRRDGTRSTVQFADGPEIAVHTDWHPGQSLVRAEIDGVAVVARVQPIEAGLRIRHRGADLRVSVLPPRQAELATLMPVKAPPDTSKFLLCPMPGLVVRIEVAEGDEVFDGQALAMVEAMKMENVLRAERRARVAKVRARAGDSLAVDDVILEFE